MQRSRTGRLYPDVGFARNEFARALNTALGPGTVSASGRTPRRPTEPPLVLLGCSGGPDSLALAAVAAHFVRRGELRVGAVIVDHQMQPGSAQVAETAAATCRELGLTPVTVATVTVDTRRDGPEMAARTARYEAFEQAVEATGAQAILLAHTLDDQAETVLLGLARGSGTRSLAGMPTVRKTDAFTVIRPLLNLRRNQIEAICAVEELRPWHDPTNADTTLARARVRHEVLPFLEEQLGGDVATALARTAAILGPDARYLDEQARAIFDSGELTAEVPGLQPPEDVRGQAAYYGRAALAALPDALRLRVLALAVTAAGGETPGFERLRALDEFVADHAKGGPLQLAGHVSAWRVRPAGAFRATGVLIIGRTR
ncbi:tRNA lysidine(34) synthetase TilS [Rothia sp. LK2588]|uniref:tRNA lysidine(34) synthetase TilS n=1 Tax=Rothia sp. LK2588 TaxID=3114369 RepID=UPI0034CDA2D4